MNFVYELLRAGSSPANSDSGAEVARKFNSNFKNVQDKFNEIENAINEGIDISIGNETKAGVVKSSKTDNNVSIKEDGTMEVNSLSTKKLTQDDNDYLILDGNTNI